ncbi:MAG TPA: T9SS type A sorting domain-containing protein [Saprospiraceae bacterium]|nr:T9SS type A sorting domain-containing protein [Saprospiraceae bacterium]
MKFLKIPIITLFIFSFCSAFSQIRLIDADTAVWRFRGFVHFDPCLYYDNQYMLSRQDTFTNGHLYRKVFHYSGGGVYIDCIEPPLGSTTPTISPRLTGLLREEDKRYYYWPTNQDAEFLAYDFNLQVGDTIPNCYYPATIDTIEEVLLNNQIYKQYIIETNFDTIIEEIGSNSFPFLCDPFTNNSVKLICFSRNDTVIFHRYDSCAFFDLPPVVTDVNDFQEFSEFESGFVKTVFPNPSDHNVSIIFNDDANYSVQISGNFGKLFNVNSHQSDRILHLDLTPLDPGLYMLIIKRDGMVIAIKKIVLI